MTAFIPADWSAGTHHGGRAQNQDSVNTTPRNDPKWQSAIAQKGVLLVVCDGVGGEAGGEVASSLAAQAALGGYYNTPGAEPRAWLEGAVRAANAAVDAERRRNPKLQSMASTFVAAAVHQGMVHTAWVGDSRAYVVSRGGKIAAITADHSFVAEQVRNKLMTEQEAEMSTMKNYILRSLGSASNTTPEFSRQPLNEGDRVVLCSDGLHGVARDPQIAEAALRAKTTSESVARLIQLARDNKTGDNVSAAVLAYDAPRKPFPLAILAGVAAVVLALVAGFLLLAAGDGASKGGVVPPQVTYPSGVPSSEGATPDASKTTLATGATVAAKPTSTLAPAGVAATEAPTAESPSAATNATPKPTALPKNNLVAPKLLSPAGGAKFMASDPPEFSWSSAGTLAADEYYVLAALHEKGEDDTWVKTLSATLKDKGYLGNAGTRIQSWRVCVAKDANPRPTNVCTKGTPLVISEERAVIWEIPATAVPQPSQCNPAASPGESDACNKTPSP